MKKMISLLLVFCMVFALAACGEKKTEPEIKEWTRQGYFMDENENMLSVTWMDDVDEPGWYVGTVLGEDWIEDAWGGMLPQEGNTLHGALPSSGSRGDLTVTVSEEGEDGLLLTVEGGEIYHFKGYEMPEATVIVTVNTEGWGYIAYAEGEETPEIDTEYPSQSAYIGLAEPAVHTFVAWPQAGNVFVKWTKDGEDFSTEPQFTVLLDESADYVAVFEEDPGWQNPVMNFIGEYQCDRAHATVMCSGFEDAWITIQWGSSAWELTQWDIFGTLNTDTLTINYSGCTKSNIVYDDNGEVKSQEPEYEGGTGTIVFNNNGTFTWYEDQSENTAGMVFTWIGADEDPEYYSAVTAMEKHAVEEQCSILRDAYLNEDWETIAIYIRYPITVNGTELKDVDGFLSYMQDKTVHDSDREAMKGETCHDMFFNGQGICFGDGELWVIDLSYMTDDPPELAIIGINGIVSK
ncbi:MAG: hypothetical protein IKO00_13785 [Oscillospiraceae bacterium]|nr:hypothetical protein [Oscillospiraceae bacterium]